MTNVVIVGAGPAGLAAADAALRAGAEVTLLDSAPLPGGQFHRMLPTAYAARHPERVHHGWAAFDRLRRRVLEHPRCAWWPDSTVWALEACGERRVADGAGQAAPRGLTDGAGQAVRGGADWAERAAARWAPRVQVLRGLADGTGRARYVLEPDALVLATGAHDRVLPFPGWQLPGVFTAGAAQALAKGERVAIGERVVVAGSGPFLLPATASLLEAGSHVLSVFEANSPGTILRGWGSRPWEVAGKAGELLGYVAGQVRRGVPYRMGRAVVAARGDGRVEEIVVASLRADWSVVPGTERTFAVDAVCVSHGFSAQLELPVVAGCELTDAGFVAVRADQRTSVAGVYAAGEITGIAGAPAAAAEGTVAGWCAAGREPNRADVRRVVAGQAFAARLARAHPIGTGWPGWLTPETVICRCEETSYDTLCAAAADPSKMDGRALRLTTRAGLGPCQARMCGPTVAELTRSRPTHRRPIAQPIRLGELAESPLQKED
ncbi:MAG TPA: FAD-dependent oxidoreductase [Pseudonocardiaceae bacterium]|nr:FAD-dependent oxidoreductase [Pseudonocardiaceae bacterium]